MFRITAKDRLARKGEFETPHGVIQTPVFMNVATVAAIKGAVATTDLETIGTSVCLANTYHLHLRPGDEIIKQLGGLHRFMSWQGPILTDSGGFQVYSLAALRQITDEGVHFRSHIDGRKIFMGPKESMRIQSNLGSTIAMAFDECPDAKGDKNYIATAANRTMNWLKSCLSELEKLNNTRDTINKEQVLFGINQGSTHRDIRIENAKQMVELNLSGYAIGGLAVGESHEEMYFVLDEVIPFFPDDKPVYLMGVGTPANILEAIGRGVDFFDCVYPSRNGRHGHLYTNHGKINLFNAQYESDERPIEEGCVCPACQRYSRAYIRHLLKSKEMLGMRLGVLHNLYFYNQMMKEAREAITARRFGEYKRTKLAAWEDL
ncbi:MAG: tRNA guanosine(34) transglycosylase Tgt [Lachnospiraceae bacterium]|jgi:queuine tRNA-ribosyltransferase|nr:tRNA guanosine(34) transglycosylase Tgt [Lachnospiraceae bacterium]